jgi:outer membrane protein OmpA-like peptidoglycan-associated protein
MKRITIIIVFCLSALTMQAQEMLGFRPSNYSGIQSLGVNPALMHNSRIDIDVNLIGIGATVENDFVFLSKDKLKFFGIKNILNKFDDKEYVTEFSFNNPNELYNANANLNVMGPGVMFNINNKHTVALTSQFRFGASAQNVQGHIGKYAYEGFGYDPLHGQNFLGKDFELNILGWLEYGLSYATTLKQDDKGALAGGITLKFLSGVAGAYARNVDLYYNVLNDSDLVFADSIAFGSIDYGRTSYNKFDDVGGFGGLPSGSGFGFDIGFTYDFLKDPSLWKYEMDGKQHIDPTVNRYKLRLGLALLDVGSIKFKDSAATFHLETAYGFYPNWDEDEYDNNWDFDETYSAIFYGDPGASLREDNFKMKLPASLVVHADWNAHKNFYVNGALNYGFKQKKTGLDRPTTVAITPRYETRWFDVSVPISYYNYTGKISRVGLAFRFASFFIGSDRIGSLLGLSDLYGMDVYTGLKFSINKERIRDYDGDRVSDKMDKCREIAGKLKFEGCPDRDNDDVPDAIDRCPDVPGLVSLNGCPDRDGDGITDADDDCPEVAGIPKFKGCPDTDGDGIQDKDDDCPSVYGLEIYKGCPDTDEDGIPDPKDDCPTAKGLPEYKGCPDTDGDGLPDPQDDCPFDVGPVSNKGCPVKVLQAPVKVEPIKVTLTAEEQEIINKVFSNLQFETGKAVIKESSYASLDELAALMKKKPNFKLQIDGHTDNVGSASLNKTLSEKRANAAKSYLESKGVDLGRITAKGHGMSKPIAPNNTPEGRAKNRRVEFLIVE